MRTNEELALLVQQGDKEAVAELWDQVHRLVFFLMARYKRICINFNIEPADLEQEGFIAVLQAAKSYDPDKGCKYTSYLGFYVKSAAKRALGFRGTSLSRIPPFVSSLDAPLPNTEDDNFTLADTIPDESAEAAFEKVQDDIQRSQFWECMEECMLDMPSDQADVFRCHYHDGIPMNKIAERKGISRHAVNTLEHKALKHLRHRRNSSRLWPFLFYDALETSDYYSCKGYGWESFRNRGYVSQVEVLAGTY